MSSSDSLITRPETELSAAPTPPPLLNRHNRFDSYDEVLRLASKRLPRSIYTELAGGPDRGVTLRGNVSAFDEVLFQPRSAIATHDRNLSTTVLGRTISMPLLVAPVGGLRIVHPQGALATVRSAGDARTIAAVSGSAGHSVDEIAAAATGPLWQQIYTSRGRERAELVMSQAAERGYAALVATVDSAVPGNRRPALRINLRNAVEFAPELLTRPRWTWRFIRDGLQLRIVNEAVGAVGTSPKMIAEWDDFTWIKETWKGPLVVKGIVTADDARRAIDVGADAIVVSNHGGLTLDGTMPTLRALPRIAHAVNGQAEILLDGGIRQGTDVVKAIAMGARAVMIGRPYIMGLAVAGEAGVRHVLENFRYEIDRTLGLLGARSIHDVDSSFIEAPSHWRS